MERMVAGWALAAAASIELSIVTKATVVLTIALVATRLARRTRASLRHLCLASAFLALVLLPPATILMPRFTVDVPSLAVEGGALSALWLPLEHPPFRISVAAWLRIAWACGAVLCLLPLVAAGIRLRRIRRHGRPWLEGEPLVRRLALHVGLKRPINVMLDEQLTSPMTCGYVRPAVMIPAGVRAWNEPDVYRAIVHELEHVRRADWPVQMMARVVCACYWFHPLVWIAWRQLCLDAEHACDDAVLTGTDGITYADQLVRLASQLLVNRTEAALPMANRSDLAARVDAVLDPRQSRGRVGWGSALTAILGAAACVVAIAPLAAVSGTDESQPVGQRASASAAVKPTQRVGLRNVGRADVGTPLDATSFCCPDYLLMVMNSIKAHWSERQDVDGEVVVRFTVQRDGRLGDVTVEQASNSEALDRAAQDAVLRTRRVSELPSQFSKPMLTVHLKFKS